MKNAEAYSHVSAYSSAEAFDAILEMDLDQISHNPEMDHRLGKLILNHSILKRIIEIMNEMMDRGLSDDSSVAENSSLKMLPSFVCSLPNGTETGHHLALDLGGTKFRVLLVKVETGRHRIEASKMYTMPREMMLGSGITLFDHIADCVANFIREQGLENRKMPLGFTFSFPCRQDDLKKARLIKWTKGYKASGVEGQDVGQLLREAMERRKAGDVELVAILNDTVGTLMALAQEDSKCRIGISLGTGTNACYVESGERCPKFKDLLQKSGYNQMLINTEWGAFGDKGELDEWRTEFDEEIDLNSINPGCQKFEKMISGMYLGELVRLILLKLTREGLLFNGKSWAQLETRDRFHGRYLSDALKTSKNGPRFEPLRLALRDFGLANPSPIDCANVARICLLVIKRAANLCASGIAAILNRLNQPKVSAAVDGSVYRCNPEFHEFLCHGIRKLITVQCEFEIKLTQDGSGRGAAIVAAVAARLNDEQKKSSVIL